MKNQFFFSFDAMFIDSMRKHGFVLLRFSLAIVYIWFGVLKIIGASPVTTLIIATYPSFPEPSFIVFLGILEVIIGLGLLFKLFLRFTLALVWLQMVGIFIGFFLAPSAYFLHNNPLLLSNNGEFVVKNFVLVAASLVIGGNLVQKKKDRLKRD